MELAPRELGRNTPPRRPNERGSGDPHGASHSSPKKGFIGPGPATARRDRDRPVARPRDQDSGTRCQHTHVHQTEEGLRNPHSVTRTSAPPNPHSGPEAFHARGDQTAPDARVPGPHSRTAGRHQRRGRHPTGPPTTMTTRSQSATTTRGAPRADGKPLRKMNGRSLHLRYSVPDSVHCSRASVLPRPGLARDPMGVAPAAPIPHGPRAGQ